MERNLVGMPLAIQKSHKKMFGLCTLTLAAVLGLLFTLRPVVAQQTGPLPPPPSYTAPTPLPQPTSMPKAAKHQTTTESPLSTAPPKIPVDQIIQKFAEREAEF